MFDAFFPTKKAVPGVVLGPSVARGINQQHHGTTLAIALPVPVLEAHLA